MTYIWNSLKDFRCLKQLIQNIVAYTQLSYKDPCIRLSNPNTCSTITSMNIWNEKYACYLICLCIFVMLNICNYYSICGTLNFVGTPKGLTKIIDYLKSKFEMKDPWKQIFFPRPTDQVLFKQNISLLVNIYKKSLEALSYW